MKWNKEVAKTTRNDILVLPLSPRTYIYHVAEPGSFWNVYYHDFLKIVIEGLLN